MNREEIEQIRVLDAALSMEYMRIQQIRTQLGALPFETERAGMLIGILYNLQAFSSNAEAIRMRSKNLLDLNPEVTARLSGERWGRFLRSIRVYTRVWWHSFSGALFRK